MKDSRLQVSLVAVLLMMFLPLRRTCILSVLALEVPPNIHLELHIFCQNPVFRNILLQLFTELTATNTHCGSRTLRFKITNFKAFHWTQSFNSSSHLPPSQPGILRFVLLLSSHFLFFFPDYIFQKLSHHHLTHIPCPLS